MKRYFLLLFLLVQSPFSSGWVNPNPHPDPDRPRIYTANYHWQAQPELARKLMRGNNLRTPLQVEKLTGCMSALDYLVAPAEEEATVKLDLSVLGPLERASSSQSPEARWISPDFPNRRSRRKGLGAPDALPLKNGFRRARSRSGFRHPRRFRMKASRFTTLPAGNCWPFRFRKKSDRCNFPSTRKTPSSTGAFWNVFPM